jgi:hypothetical protein
MFYLELLLLYVIGTFPVLIAIVGGLTRTVLRRRAATA